MGSQIMRGSNLTLALVLPLPHQLNQDFQQSISLHNHPRFQSRQHIQKQALLKASNQLSFPACLLLCVKLAANSLSSLEIFFTPALHVVV